MSESARQETPASDGRAPDKAPESTASRDDGRRRTPSRPVRIAWVLSLEYAAVLVCVLTAFSGWRLVTRVTGTPGDAFDAYMIPTDTTLKAAFATVDAEAIMEPAGPVLAALATRTAWPSPAPILRVRLGDVLAAPTSGGPTFFYAAVLDRRVRLKLSNDDPLGHSNAPPRAATQWSVASRAWAEMSKPQEKKSETNGGQLLKAPVQQEPLNAERKPAEPDYPAEKGPKPSAPDAEPGAYFFIHPNVVASATMSALLDAERRGMRSIAIVPPESPDPVDQFEDGVVSGLAKVAGHLRSVRNVSILSRQAIAVRSESTVATQVRWPDLPSWWPLETPSPWPGGRRFGEARIVDPSERAMNPAYRTSERTTLLPALLYLTVLGAVVAGRLRRAPESQLQPTWRGGLVGAVAAVAFVAVLNFLASFWIWLPDNWLASAAGVSFVAGACGLLMGWSSGEVRALWIPIAPPPPQPDTPLRSVLYNERPIDDVKQDRLGFAALVRALARFLDNPATKPPVVLAINGPWGSGKSSLMKMLARELEGTGRFRTVWFNSWQYHKEDQVLAAFLQSISTQLAKRWGPLFALRLAWARLKKYSYLEHLGLLIAVLLAVGGVLGFHEKMTSDTAAGVPTTALSSVALLGGAAWIREVLLPFRLRFRKLWAVRDQSQRLGFFDEFTRELQLYREAVGSRCKFLIAIDDLDRCAPEHVVDVLKTVNLIVTGGGAGQSFFVLGYDAKYILRSIETYYSSMARAGQGFDQRFGPEYLKKMVNVSVSVPVADSREILQMISSIDNEKSETDAVKDTTLTRWERVVGWARRLPDHLREIPPVVPRFMLAVATVLAVAFVWSYRGPAADTRAPRAVAAPA